MTDDTPKPDSAPDADAPEAVRANIPVIQPLLMAALVAAIILMIAMGAFWTSF